MPIEQLIRHQTAVYAADGRGDGYFGRPKNPPASLTDPADIYAYLEGYRDGENHPRPVED